MNEAEVTVEPFDFVDFFSYYQEGLSDGRNAVPPLKIWFKNDSLKERRAYKLGYAHGQKIREGDRI